MLVTLVANRADAVETVVANYTGNSLYLVDLTSGNRTLLSSSTQGTGPALSFPVSLVLHPNGFLYSAGDSTTTITKINVTTGDRTTLPNPGSVVYAQIYGLAVNAAGNLIASSAIGEFYEIDVNTGLRTTIGSSSVGTGAAIGNPGGFLIENDGNIVYTNFGGWQLIRLNVTTLVRTVISSSTVGTGLTFGSSGTVVKLSNGDFAVSGYSFSGPGAWIIRVDPTTGNRTALTSNIVGTGPAIGRVFSLAIASDGSIFASDAGNNAILNVDPTTGNRTIISQVGTGTGPAFSFPLGILPVAVASVSAGSGTPYLDAATYSGTVNSTFSFRILASNTPTSYAATGLPAGLSINTSTGLITGTPTAGGSFVVILSATNASGTMTAPMYLNIAPASQTVTFGALANKVTTDAAITLSATSSSGLSITYTVVSGPAMLSGSTLTLTGATGTVVVRAVQSGNANYAASSSVTQSFVVSPVAPQVYFGTLSASSGTSDVIRPLVTDTIAGYIATDNKTGSLVGYLSATKQGFVFDFTVATDGSFDGTAQSYTAASTQATAITIRGRVVDGVITGTIVSPAVTFTATMQPQTGTSAALSGYYVGRNTNTVNGSTYSVVGTDARVFALAITPGLVTAGTGTVTTAGAFTVAADASNTITGSVNSTTTAVSGTLTGANGLAVTFSGIKSTTARTDRLINLSSRAQVGAGERALFTGLVIAGPASKPVLIRAVGSALAIAGISGALADPELKLYQNTTVIASNDNWADNTNATTITQTAQRIGAFSIASSAKEAALLVTLAPGVYSAQVTGHGGAGVALAEIYDASENAQADYQRLINISSRGYVGTGENVLIGGFIVTGTSPKRVLVRGVGPTLASYGVGETLKDPVVQVLSGTTIVARNDNWGTPAVVSTSQTAATAAEITSATAAVGASPLVSASKDAALIVTLAPGTYSAVVTSADGTSGVGLVEIYELAD